MPYVPPTPGSTTPGQPTPEGVKKQDAHIADLPPEVRRSFLLSMVFFPSLVGATICLIMFLGWWTLFKPKEAPQYARDLRSADMRRRWQAARELGEAMQPAPVNEKGEILDTVPDEKIYQPEVLGALIEIVQNAELDQETEVWSPASMIKQGDERSSRLRWWAAAMIGHFAAVLPDPVDRERGYQALIGALHDKSDANLAVYACRGLSLLKDPRAGEHLVKMLNSDDSGVKAAAAVALGCIGFHAICHNTKNVDLDAFRTPLRATYKAGGDRLVLDNTAIALARLKDGTGKDRLEQMQKSDEDPVVRDHARRALETLTGIAQ
jgi:hypothetical protein